MERKTAFFASQKLDEKISKKIIKEEVNKMKKLFIKISKISVAVIALLSVTALFTLPVISIEQPSDPSYNSGVLSINFYNEGFAYSQYNVTTDQTTYLIGGGPTGPKATKICYSNNKGEEITLIDIIYDNSLQLKKAEINHSNNTAVIYDEKGLSKYDARIREDGTYIITSIHKRDAMGNLIEKWIIDSVENANFDVSASLKPIFIDINTGEQVQSSDYMVTGIVHCKDGREDWTESVLGMKLTYKGEEIEFVNGNYYYKSSGAKVDLPEGSQSDEIVKTWQSGNGSLIAKYFWYGNQLLGVVNFADGKTVSLTGYKDAKLRGSYKLSDTAEVTISNDGELLVSGKLLTFTYGECDIVYDDNDNILAIEETETKYDGPKKESMVVYDIIDDSYGVDLDVLVKSIKGGCGDYLLIDYDGDGEEEKIDLPELFNKMSDEDKRETIKQSLALAKGINIDELEKLEEYNSNAKIDALVNKVQAETITPFVFVDGQKVVLFSDEELGSNPAKTIRTFMENPDKDRIKSRIIGEGVAAEDGKGNIVVADNKYKQVTSELFYDRHAREDYMVNYNYINNTMETELARKWHYNDSPGELAIVWRFNLTPPIVTTFRYGEGKDSVIVHYDEYKKEDGTTVECWLDPRGNPVLTNPDDPESLITDENDKRIGSTRTFSIFGCQVLADGDLDDKEQMNKNVQDALARNPNIDLTNVKITYGKAVVTPSKTEEIEDKVEALVLIEEEVTYGAGALTHVYDFINVTNGFTNVSYMNRYGDQRATFQCICDIGGILAGDMFSADFEKNDAGIAYSFFTPRTYYDPIANGTLSLDANGSLTMSFDYQTMLKLTYLQLTEKAGDLNTLEGLNDEEKKIYQELLKSAGKAYSDGIDASVLKSDTLKEIYDADGDGVCSVLVMTINEEGITALDEDMQRYIEINGLIADYNRLTADAQSINDFIGGRQTWDTMEEKLLKSGDIRFRYQVEAGSDYYYRYKVWSYKDMNGNWHEELGKRVSVHVERTSRGIAINSWAAERKNYYDTQIPSLKKELKDKLIEYGYMNADEELDSDTFKYVRSVDASFIDKGMYMELNDMVLTNGGSIDLTVEWNYASRTTGGQIVIFAERIW